MGVLNHEAHCLHVIGTCIGAFLLQGCLCVTVLLAFSWIHTWWNHIPLSWVVFSYIALWTIEMASHWCEKITRAKKALWVLEEWNCPCLTGPASYFPLPVSIDTWHEAYVILDGREPIFHWKPTSRVMFASQTNKESVYLKWGPMDLSYSPRLIEGNPQNPFSYLLRIKGIHCPLSAGLTLGSISDSFTSRIERLTALGA